MSCSRDGLSAAAAMFSLLLVLSAAGPLSAELTVLRDSIGPDSSLTDGLPGASAIRLGSDWATPGFLFDVSQSAYISEVQLIIFARDINGLPENDLENILGYPMEFHVWSDGIQGGPDSFYENAIGDIISGHTRVDVNSVTESFITATEFGTTGPPDDPTAFKTFLVTIDLSSFGIFVEGGESYVAAVVQAALNFSPGGGGSFRVSHSLATGFEDLYQQVDTPPQLLPGFLDTQLGIGFQQHAARITIDTLPLPGDGNGDGWVDGLDYLLWAGAYGTHPGPDGDISDGDYNDDGWVDGLDYLLWAGEYGSHSATSVPEPTPLSLLVLALTLIVASRQHRSSSC